MFIHACTPDSIERTCKRIPTALLQASEVLPEGWTEHRDQQTGRKYYFDAATGTSHWQLPSAGPAVPQLPADICALHTGEPKKLWCASCRQCICRDCMYQWIDKSGLAFCIICCTVGAVVDHRDHEYDFLGAMFHKHRPKMVPRRFLFLASFLWPLL